MWCLNNHKKNMCPTGNIHVNAPASPSNNLESGRKTDKGRKWKLKRTMTHEDIIYTIKQETADRNPKNHDGFIPLKSESILRACTSSELSAK